MVIEIHNIFIEEVSTLFLFCVYINNKTRYVSVCTPHPHVLGRGLFLVSSIEQQGRVCRKREKINIMRVEIKKKRW